MKNPLMPDITPIVHEATQAFLALTIAINDLTHHVASLIAATERDRLERERAEREGKEAMAKLFTDTSVPLWPAPPATTIHYGGAS